MGFYQYAVVSGDRDANLSRVAEALAGSRFDLLVLPELFTSGYSNDDPARLAGLAEVLDDSPTVRSLAELAGRGGGVIVGGLPEWANGVFYNTGVAVSGNGLVGRQRKIHLTDYEKRFFTPGDSADVIRIGGIAIALVTCFNCWFPALCALFKQRGAQVFCCPSNFGGPVTPTFIPVRARENQVFVVSCNRVGEEAVDGTMESFCGCSQICSPDGEMLAQSGGGEALEFVDVDPGDCRRPAFASQICRDFTAEQNRYDIALRT